MADRLPLSGRAPSGTTFPRGFGDEASIQWPLVPARELFDLRYGKALVEENRRPGSIPVYGTNGRCGSHDTALFPGPGVILGRKGQGPLGVEWSEGDYWVIDTAYTLVPRRADIDLKYAYFLIKFIGLNHLKDGTSNPSLSRDTFGAQALPLPPLAAQHAIAHLLGTLDEKIEVNRRMNETLEAMAHALFKSWFVDFDPVRARAEGRDPGLPTPVADVFPERFDDSELGAIPAGWKVVPLGAVCSRITDGSHHSPKSVDVGYPMASVKDMTTWGFDLAGCRRVSQHDYQDLLRNDCRPLAHDILIAKDGSYLKHIFVVEKDLDLVILSSIAILRPNEKMNPHLLAFSLRSEQVIARMERYVSGAVLQRIVLKDFRGLSILLPAKAVQQAWAHIAEPLIQRIWRGVDESSSLDAIRDALLPMLLSGQIRAKEAEQLVGTVA